VERMVQKVVKEFVKIDILVNNVGMVGAGGPVTEMTEEQWDLMLAVNLKSQFLCCKYVLPHMMKQKSGKIINFDSSVKTPLIRIAGVGIIRYNIPNSHNHPVREAETDVSST